MPPYDPWAGDTTGLLQDAYSKRMPIITYGGPGPARVLEVLDAEGGALPLWRVAQLLRLPMPHRHERGPNVLATAVNRLVAEGKLVVLEGAFLAVPETAAELPEAAQRVQQLFEPDAGELPYRAVIDGTGLGENEGLCRLAINYLHGRQLLHVTAPDGPSSWESMVFKLPETAPA